MGSYWLERELLLERGILHDHLSIRQTRYNFEFAFSFSWFTSSDNTWFIMTTNDVEIVAVLQPFV